MSTDQSFPLKGILLAISGFLVFSIGDACVKWLGQSYSTVQIAAIYFIIATIMLSLFSRNLGGLKNTFKTKRLGLHIVRALILMACVLLNIYAFSKLPMTSVYTLLFASPFVAAILAVLMLKNRISTHSWLAIIVGFIGVIIALQPDSSTVNLLFLIPLLSAVLFALANIMVKIIGEKETYLSYALFPCMIPIIPALAFSAGSYVPVTGIDILIFLLGGTMMGGGFLLTGMAFRYAPAAIAAPFQYTQIIWGTLFGVLIFSETPEPWTIIGATIIIASGIYLIRQEHKNSKSLISQHQA